MGDFALTSELSEQSRSYRISLNERIGDFISTENELYLANVGKRWPGSGSGQTLLRFLMAYVGSPPGGSLCGWRGFAYRPNADGTVDSICTYRYV